MLVLAKTFFMTLLQKLDVCLFRLAKTLMGKNKIVVYIFYALLIGDLVVISYKSIKRFGLESWQTVVILCTLLLILVIGETIFYSSKKGSTIANNRIRDLVVILGVAVFITPIVALYFSWYSVALFTIATVMYAGFFYCAEHH